ncbi:MAG: AraC family transcriptional regulator [Clostridiales bacterium]|nr:AraC family transcriptional regulator [Clostridiales bacterium]
MEYGYESIKHQVEMPIKIFTQTVGEFPYHWHEEIEILFVLEGSLEIRVSKKPYHLNEGDLFIVNKNELHFIKSTLASGNTQLLALQFEDSYFKKYGLVLTDKKFQMCLNDDTQNRSDHYQIKNILAKMMNQVLNKEPYYNLRLEQLLLDLVILLMSQYQQKDESKEESVSDDKLLEILEYINEICTDASKNVKDIADHFYFSSQYLSRYFKSQVGISVKKFLDHLRLNKSLFALKTSDERILDIALKYGFPDSKAYYRVFKEVFDITPKEYRDQHKILLEDKTNFDYFSINSQDSLRKLFKYIEVESKETPLSTSEYQELINLDLRRPYQKDYMKLMTFGYAPHGLRTDLTAQLTEAKKDLGYDYLRFHGIFSDELKVCYKNEDGSLEFNFNHIDALLDNLINIGVKPFLEIGYMPKALSDSEKTIFAYELCVSPPNDYSDWQELISRFMKHIINRYGLDEVLTWYFELWNEPEVEGIFWTGSREEFFKLFKVTFETIKDIHQNFKLGGFGMIYFEENNSWLLDFEQYALKEKLTLDFFSFHIYNISFEENLTDILSDYENIGDEADYDKTFMNRLEIFRGHKDYITERIDVILERIGNLAVVKSEYFITEWNSVTDSRDLTHDTCYMGPFIVKNVIENGQKLNGMGFWTLSDIFEEFTHQQPIFHGGFGMMTYNGLKKPSYYAYQFLSRLGDEIIAQAPGYIVTKSGEDIQCLFYNYLHTNNLYNHFDTSQISPHDRYRVFEKGERKVFALGLKGLEGKYKIIKQLCDRKHGSVYDEWVKMGAPKEMTQEITDHLKCISKPEMTIKEDVIDEIYQLNVHLEPHGILLVEFKKHF